MTLMIRLLHMVIPLPSSVIDLQLSSITGTIIFASGLKPPISVWKIAHQRRTYLVSGTGWTYESRELQNGSVLTIHRREIHPGSAVDQNGVNATVIGEIERGQVLNCSLHADWHPFVRPRSLESGCSPSRASPVIITVAEKMSPWIGTRKWR